MLTILRGGERGYANHGWLESYHTFSFADYYDPDRIGFRALRVINEDRVEPGRGFGAHGHRNMEIVSYILDGALAHHDSLGTGSVLRRGHVQRMTAGTGVTHSERNASETEPVHFLQIWLLPQSSGLSPSYEERVYPDEDKRGRLRLIVSPDGRGGSLSIHQDVELYAALLQSGDAVEHELAPDRHAWLQLADGEVELNGEPLRAGDGVAASDERRLTISSASRAELLLFDLA